MGAVPAFGETCSPLRIGIFATRTILLGAVDKVVGLSTSQKSAVQGFAKTIQRSII